MKSSVIILSLIAISLSSCSHTPDTIPPQISSTVDTANLASPDSPTFDATEWAITKIAEAEVTPNNSYLFETPTPISSSNLNFPYDSQMGLYNLVDELSFQMSKIEYNEFLEFQNEWEYLARSQCRWQGTLFFESSNQYSDCLDKQYRQRIAILLVLICRNNERDYYRPTEDCPKAEKYKVFIQE